MSLTIIQQLTLCKAGPHAIISQLLFVGMYATLGMSMPSQHFVHAQD
jgi:hypothetical protein